MWSKDAEGYNTFRQVRTSINVANGTSPQLTSEEGHNKIKVYHHSSLSIVSRKNAIIVSRRLNQICQKQIIVANNIKPVILDGHGKLQYGIRSSLHDNR